MSRANGLSNSGEQGRDGKRGGGRAQGDGIRRGRVRRVAPLAALSARTAGEAVVVGLRKRVTGVDSEDFHVRTAERYAELLGNSKGALMKAGQIVSFAPASVVIPSEFQGAYQTALSRLRDSAPPMAPELARKVLESELEAPVERTFAEFDWSPLAAASIGQVHAARLRDGREVAVKVQYPGVAAAIEADLKNNDLLFTFLALLSGMAPRGISFDLRGTAREIRARIGEELDYRLEADSQSEFADIYRGHPFIRVPEVVREFSTGRVLTQDLARGKAWEEAVAAERGLRDIWGEAIMRFHYESFERCFSNTDTHPGNYLFHDDGGVTFLDFGSVKRLEPGTVAAMLSVVAPAIRGELKATAQAVARAGFVADDAPVSEEELYEYWRAPYEMYWTEQPFTLSQDYLERHVEQRYSPAGPYENAWRYLTLPSDFFLMFRGDVGVVSLLAGLRATNDWHALAEEYFEGRTPRTEVGKLNAAFFAEREAVTSDD